MNSRREEEIRDIQVREVGGREGKEGMGGGGMCRPKEQLINDGCAASIWDTLPRLMNDGHE